MDNIEAKLTAALYRFTCPDETELGEYHLGLLERERETAVASHLETCPHCTRELVQLETFMATIAPDLEVSLVEKVKVWIAQRLPDPNQGNAAFRPAFAVRGQEEGLNSYAAEDAHLSIEIQEDIEHPGNKTLLGLVIGIDPANAKIQLSQDEALVSATAVDEIGNFIISNLTPGDYELILSGSDFEIHIQELVVN